jgi:imidazolonepropionase-like amidohydrolase
VIDGTGKAPLRDSSVIISGERIQEIGPSARIKAPSGAQVVDLTGKTVMPGIINLHGHVNGDTAAKLRTYAKYGVTSTTSLGGDTNEILKIKADESAGRLGAARVYTALQRFEPNDAIVTGEQARAEVDRLASAGADLIKVWIDSLRGTRRKLSPEVATAAIAQAHKHGLKAFAHIYEYSDAKFVADQNVDVLAHEVRDREVDDALIQELIAKRITVIPTLVRDQSTYIFADSPAWLNDPLFVRLTPAEVQENAKTKLKDQQAADPDSTANRRDYELSSRNVRKMFAAGVRIGLGTDSTGGANRFQGFYEHREMELMVDAGLTPMQVIHAFSQINSEALGIEKDYGTLAPGKIADLVVLDANPLDNILNTRKISAVYIGGKKFD